MALKFNESVKSKQEDLLKKYQDRVFGTPSYCQDPSFLKLQANLSKLEDLCSRMDFMVDELKGLVKIRKY